MDMISDVKNIHSRKVYIRWRNYLLGEAQMGMSYPVERKDKSRSNILMIILKKGIELWTRKK